MRRLLIRPGAIGDCILAFPALKFLRTTYTEIWVPGPVVPLVSFGDKVASIASTGLDLVGVGDLPMSTKLREHLRSFDEIVSWYGANRTEFREMLTGLGVPCMFHSALPPKEGEVHATDFFCAQVGAPSGVVPHIELHSAIEQRQTVAVHPFSGSRSKNWPLSSFRDLAEQLDVAVDWVAGPDDVFPGAYRSDNLKAVAEWIAGARVYLGNDSGITHLAAAAGIRTVALFGSTLPSVWGPRGQNVTILRHEPIAEMAVEQVADLLAKILETAV